VSNPTTPPMLSNPTVPTHAPSSPTAPAYAHSISPMMMSSGLTSSHASLTPPSSGHKSLQFSPQMMRARCCGGGLWRSPSLHVHSQAHHASRVLSLSNHVSTHEAGWWHPLNLSPPCMNCYPLIRLAMSQVATAMVVTPVQVDAKYWTMDDVVSSTKGSTTAHQIAPTSKSMGPDLAPAYNAFSHLPRVMHIVVLIFPVIAFSHPHGCICFQVSYIFR
jgi:hypothetical protein